MNTKCCIPNIIQRCVFFPDQIRQTKPWTSKCKRDFI